MKLSELLQKTDISPGTGDLQRLAGDVQISGISVDSRTVEPGHLFAALPGAQQDGRAFIPDAIERGAAAILVPSDSDVKADGAVVLQHDNPRLALARVARRFYAGQPAHLVAVTGTNGKTSVASFARQIWKALGHKSASIGTLGVESDEVSAVTGLTTPDTVTFQKNLSALSSAGVSHAIVEASSHGLSQYRMDGADFTIAAFTNLSRDHLDYHGDMDSYFAAKARLFDEILPLQGVAVINVDDSRGAELAAHLSQSGRKVLRVGSRDDADLHIDAIQPAESGSGVKINFDGATYMLMVPLMGPFQVHNAALAAGIVIADGADAAAVFDALERLEGVNGRMELVGQTPAGGTIVIDYAHTPDGLEAALSALRAHTAGALHVVFGCGGDRDKGKRPLMGEIAARLADQVLVTDDNPRSEEAATIRAEIMAACPDAQEQGDRLDAIRTATRELRAGDTLLVTGKGHEEGQIVGNQILPFSDLKAVQQCLQELRDGQVGGAE